MEFEPIKLERDVQPTMGEAAAGLPHTISLSAKPSAEWQQHFESFAWESLGLTADRFPRVVDGGIAIPDAFAGRLERLLDHIDEAMTQTNAAEAKRVEGMPPDAQTTYFEWFDSRSLA